MRVVSGQKLSASKERDSKWSESRRISPRVRSGSSVASLVLGGGRGYVSSVGVCGTEEEVDGTVEPRDKVGGEEGRGGGAGWALRWKLRMERRRRTVEEKVRTDGEGEAARGGAMLCRSSSSSSSSSE